MKFLILGDLHGLMPDVHTKDIDAIICVGDFCSSDKHRKYMFQAITHRLANLREKKKWYDFCGKEEAEKLISISMTAGRAILEKLNALDIPIYVVPGNGDWTTEHGSHFLDKDLWQELIKGLDNITDCHKKKIDLGMIEIIGYGISSGPEFPQYKEDIDVAKVRKKLEKKKASYEKNKKEIQTLFEQATKPILFLSHNVPFNTPLDQINNQASPRHGQHFGSLIVKEIIEEFQPSLCIAGHMHEHFGKHIMGETTVINAGFGGKVYTTLTLNSGNIKELTFHPQPYGNGKV